MVGLGSFKSELKVNLYSLAGKKIYRIMEGDAIPDLFIPQLIDMYKEGKLPVDKFIKYYKFDEVDKAIEDMEKGVTVKPILKF